MEDLKGMQHPTRDTKRKQKKEEKCKRKIQNEYKMKSYLLFLWLFESLESLELNIVCLRTDCDCGYIYVSERASFEILL